MGLLETIKQAIHETDAVWTASQYSDEKAALHILTAMRESPEAMAEMKRRAAVHMIPDDEEPSEGVLDRVEAMLRAALTPVQP